MSGRAISFAMPDQGSKVREIEKLTRLYLPISKLPDLPPNLNLPSDTFNNPNRSNYPPHRNRPARVGRQSGRFGYGRRK
jgi:hypothetical protein